MSSTGSQSGNSPRNLFNGATNRSTEQEQLGNNSLSLVVFISVVVCLISSPARSATYNANPRALMELGRGFNSAKGEGRDVCVTDAAPGTQQHAGGQTNFGSSVISSLQDLHTAFHIDASLDAKIGFASLQSSFALDRSYDYTASDLVWVLTASQDYGHKAYGQPQLNVHGKSFSNAGDFKNRCGTEWVSAEHRIAQISVVFEMHNLTTAQRQSLALQVAAAGSSGVNSGKFVGNLNDVMTSATSTKSVVYKIWALGGEGITELVGSSTLASGGVDDLAARIEKYIKTFKFENSFPIEFTTDDYSGLRQGMVAGTLSKRGDVLNDLFYPYVTYATDADRLNRILTGINNEYAFLTGDQVTNYRKQLIGLRFNRDRLRDAGLACLADELKCKSVNISPVRVAWPRIDPECITWEVGDCIAWVKPVIIKNQALNFPLQITVEHLPDGEASAVFDGQLQVTQGPGDGNVKILNAYTALKLTRVDTGEPVSDCALDAVCFQEQRSFSAWQPFHLTSKAKVVDHKATFLLTVAGCDYTGSAATRCSTSDGSVLTVNANPISRDMLKAGPID